MNYIKTLGPILTICLLGGCATIVKGTTQTISIDTPGAPGAKCILSSTSVGTKKVTTPVNITVDKGSNNITVTCKKRCFHDGKGVISSNVEGMAAGNIVVGGLIGLGVDAATGAMNKYNTNNQIAMVRIPGCR